MDDRDARGRSLATGNGRAAGRVDEAVRPPADARVVGSHRRRLLVLLVSGRGPSCHTVVMVHLSVLDLAPITQGSDAAAALRNTLDRPRHAERLGFHRYWLAEHHNMPGIASAGTSIVIGHVAAGTRAIRVGAGGIILPNHAPLVIARQFGTLG